MQIQERVSLKEWTFWKIGGLADYFCLPTTIEEVQNALSWAGERGLPVTVLGGGTNVLISDAGIAGLVIAMRGLRGTTVEERMGRIYVVALAGTPKSELTKIFLSRRLQPALFLCGLPGDVGGGVVMNAGVTEIVKPREFVDLVDWVEFCDGREVARRSREELQWKYRHSSGWHGVIVKAGLSWSLTPDPDLPAKVKAATKSRLERQPLELPSCGSTFKNPTGAKAGALIDQAGLKGYKIGGAMISPKHANFIVNVGGASAADVGAIINHIRQVVKAKFAVDLETEVRFLGRT